MRNKTIRNIFIAFILNLFFSIFELIGGILTNSVSIISTNSCQVNPKKGNGFPPPPPDAPVEAMPDAFPPICAQTGPLNGSSGTTYKPDGSVNKMGLLLQ